MSGLLLLTKQSNILSCQFDKILKHAAELVSRTLYVYLQIPDEAAHIDQQQTSTNRGLYRKIASSIYASELQFGLDCRVLLTHAKKKDDFSYEHLSNRKIEFVFTDAENVNTLSDTYFRRFVKFDPSVKIFKVPLGFGPDELATAIADDSMFDYSVLGGTFDHLHSGHKVLLSEAVMLTKRRLTIGVTDDSMLRNKVLSELVQPLAFRMHKVREFLDDIDWSLVYDIVPISDPFGPSVTDARLQCIVVSEETYKGGLKVNEERIARNLSELHIHPVELVPDQIVNNKISSTQLRSRDLGKLMDVRPERANRCRPYVIGLTGGIASGKTSVARRLEKLGAYVIDCDKLGHLSYRVGSPAYRAIVEKFGADIVDSSSDEIDRKVLGSKVFSSPEDLTGLNKIVWPEVARLVTEEIDKLKVPNGGKCKSVVVVDAALLLEAGWDNFVDQVWVCFVPKEEATKRVIKRNGVTESEAHRRIESQMTNEARIRKANALFCTLWEQSVTQEQVENAWKELDDLLQRI